MSFFFTPTNTSTNSRRHLFANTTSSSAFFFSDNSVIEREVRYGRSGTMKCFDRKTQAGSA